MVAVEFGRDETLPAQTVMVLSVGIDSTVDERVVLLLVPEGGATVA